MTAFVFPLQVNVGTFAFLFSEMVQYSNGRVTSLTQLHEKLANVCDVIPNNPDCLITACYVRRQFIDF